MSEVNKVEKIRYTILVNPKLLSKLKIVSFIENRKVSDVIDSVLEKYMNEFESKNKKIDFKTIIPTNQ